MNNNRDCDHGNKIGCCQHCEIIILESHITQLELEYKNLTDEVVKLRGENVALSIESNHLSQWQELAFQAHPNIDLDIERAEDERLKQ